MGEPLRVLIVEDSEGDALLLLAHLKRNGYDLEWERVEDELSMAAALALIRDQGIDLPFIIVSGDISEEVAVDCMKAGAHDYVNKDNMARLVPAIQRELREAAARREHRRVEEALLESLQMSMETVQAIPSGLFIYQHKSPDRLILVSGNPEAEKLTGKNVEEWLGRDFDEIWPEAKDSGITQSFRKVLETGEIFESEELSYEDNKLKGFFRVRAFPMAGGRLGVAFENVTEYKRAEEALAWESAANAAIAELSGALLQPASIEDVSSLCLDCAKRLTGSEFGYVGYIDPATGYLVSPTLTTGIWDVCQVADKNIVFEEFGGLWGWVLNHRKPILTNAPSEDSRSTGVPAGHVPIQRFLSAPAMIGDTLVGQVALANSDRDYTERDLKLVERLSALYAIAVQRMRTGEELQDRSHELGERVKKLNCLYGISRLVETPGVSLEEILQGTADLIPPSWQYPEIACARITLEDKEVTTQGCVETPWRQASDILVHGVRIGFLEIFYKEERPERDEGPFLKEERDLINEISERLGHVIEQKRTEEALHEALESSRKHAAETSSLLGSARTILERGGLEEMEEAIFDACKNLIGATAGYIALLSESGENNDVVFLDSGGRPCTVDPNLPMPIRGLRAEAYSTGKPVYDNNFSGSEWTKFLPDGHMGMDNVMFAPLILKGKAVGVIGLANKPGGFTDDDTRMASAFADQAAIALQNSRNLEALRNSEARYRKLSASLEDKVKEKMAELRQAESLATIGRMVSIVAHEVRNPLQNIQMGVDSIRIELGDDEDKAEILEEIDYGVDLLNGIIAELLDYSRPVTLKRSPQSINDLVEQALKTLTHKLDNINVQLVWKHDARKVEVDAFRIGAVLVNLISNAVEAMPAGGDLKIGSAVSQDNGLSMLKLSISDTGCGIADDDLKQIDEPFFTTKIRGTGLGIPVCKKIAEAHSGSLVITSKLNEGTTVELLLPLESGEPPQA